MVSLGLLIGAGVTTAAETAGPTPIDVSAYELPYDAEPSNLAIITYSPCSGGVHIVWNMPLASLVTMPMSCMLPFGSNAVSLTGTPFAFVGLICCS